MKTKYEYEFIPSRLKTDYIIVDGAGDSVTPEMARKQFNLLSKFGPPAETRLNVRGRNHYYFDNLGMKVLITTDSNLGE